MRVKNITILFTSAILLSASLFLAPAAFAEGDVCPGTHLDKTGSATLEGGGSLSWGGTSLTYTVPDGGTLTLCIKAGDDNAQGGGGTWTSVIEGPAGPTTVTTANDTDGVSLGGHDISHISYTYTYTEPSDPEPSATGVAQCDGQVSEVAVTVTPDGHTGGYEVSVNGGTKTAYATDSFEVPVPNNAAYTITVFTTGAAEPFATLTGTSEDCTDPAATVTADCATGAVVAVTGDEGDVFVVSLNGTAIDELTVGPSGTDGGTYPLPAADDQVITVSHGGDPLAFDEADCATEVDPVVIEKPEQPAAPEQPAVEDEDEVEVLPQVLERDELPLTGTDEDRMLVIALALLGLGLPLTLVKPKAQRVD